MKPKIYIETTIPSYYCEIREDTESAAKRQWTREWWDNHRRNYELVTGPNVIDELERGDYPTKRDTMKLVEELPILEISGDIESIIAEYISHKLMPRDPGGDALHLALASYYHCQFLLTWNCQNLANANKFEHIRHVNTLLGLFVPIMTTPYELMFEEV
ncbi:MAG: type II toxin-antitoxin system VapC family toxin [Elusimicrobia bacterium]|nr:type II toxin-antitoxin system VapC family toxin [Elusimicrobiota bacterium]